MFCMQCGRALAELPPTYCPECNEPHWLNPKPSASALVIHDNAVLLVERANEPWKGAWDIPGGFCDPTEHPEATAIREVREEVGLDITITGFLGIWMDEYSDRTGAAGERPVESTLNIYYMARATHPCRFEINPSEVKEARYFQGSELPAALAFPKHIGPVLNAWTFSAAVRGSTIVEPDTPPGSDWDGC
ncbi:MAG: NUDIX domain-containing protein [Acidimicrobiia bacterium]|nr:NUDIX domain-containing protein [Acidimicrobiia bacterium]MYE74065.1 NUDIX domain-containing protein [Acidimicrobiia bacterium]MYJ60891.1 NUDIX domain-containing protein [Acidimicrobiia bacterium]